ncbi:MAG TPA: hypothetical protein VMT24_18270 [Aggregatilineaceae bacterium]|jgi:hypothetical protein|nr:hypothetical protein [Aggregatilineaceae bacterium]
MSDQHSLFFDEWKACLRAHYVYVLRAGDRVTEPTLRQVLLQTGLDEEDLRALQEEAFALGAIQPGLELEPPPPAGLSGEPDDLLDQLPEEPAVDLEEDTHADQDEDELDSPPPPVPSGQLPLF